MIINLNTPDVGDSCVKGRGQVGFERGDIYLGITIGFEGGSR